MIKDNYDKVQEKQNAYKLLFCNKINTTHEAEALLVQFLLKVAMVVNKQVYIMGQTNAKITALLIRHSELFCERNQQIAHDYELYSLQWTKT